MHLPPELTQPSYYHEGLELTQPCLYHKKPRISQRELVVYTITAISIITALITAVLGAHADVYTMTLCAYMLPIETGIGMILVFLAIVLPLPSERDKGETR